MLVAHHIESILAAPSAPDSQRVLCRNIHAAMHVRLAKRRSDELERKYPPYVFNNVEQALAQGYPMWAWRNVLVRNWSANDPERLGASALAFTRPKTRPKSTLPRLSPPSPLSSSSSLLVQAGGKKQKQTSRLAASGTRTIVSSKTSNRATVKKKKMLKKKQRSIRKDDGIGAQPFDSNADYGDCDSNAEDGDHSAPLPLRPRERTRYRQPSFSSSPSPLSSSFFSTIPFASARASPVIDGAAQTTTSAESKDGHYDEQLGKREPPRPTATRCANDDKQGLARPEQEGQTAGIDHVCDSHGRQLLHTIDEATNDLHTIDEATNDESKRGAAPTGGRQLEREKPKLNPPNSAADESGHGATDHAGRAGSRVIEPEPPGAPDTASTHISEACDEDPCAVVRILVPPRESRVESPNPIPASPNVGFSDTARLPTEQEQQPEDDGQVASLQEAVGLEQKAPELRQSLATLSDPEAGGLEQEAPELHQSLTTLSGGAGSNLDAGDHYDGMLVFDNDESVIVVSNDSGITFG